MSTSHIIEEALPHGFYCAPYYAPVPNAKCYRCSHNEVVQGLYLTSDNMFVVHGCRQCRFRWLIAPGAMPPPLPRPPLPNVPPPLRIDTPVNVETDESRARYTATLRDLVTRKLTDALSEPFTAARLEAAMFDRVKGDVAAYTNLFKRLNQSGRLSADTCADLVTERTSVTSLLV